MQYEMCLKVADICEGKMGDTSGSAIALSGQFLHLTRARQSQEEDLTDVTCYGCGKKGHLKRRCSDKLKVMR